MRRIRTVLDDTRNPQQAADVPHRYDDKYLLAEVLTRVAAASLLQCLEAVGMSAEHLAKMQPWARTRSVTIRLRAGSSAPQSDRRRSTLSRRARTFSNRKPATWGPRRSGYIVVVFLH